MRKQTLKQQIAATEGDWLDLEALASVEVSSEEADFPIEGALVPGVNASGWRAATLGPQMILIRFDHPQRVRRLSLSFVEEEHERQQEFSLRWAAEDGRAGEIVRQQWTFSPSGANREEEAYTVDLPSIATLTFEIDPDRGRNRYPATLAALRLA